MFRLHVWLMVPIAVLISGVSAYAQTALSATLTNAAENPPTVPTLSTGGARLASFGSATFVLNASQTSMTFTATIFNIDFTGSQTADVNDNLTAAHIHASATVTPTTNAPVVWGFFGNPFNDNNPNDVKTTPFASGVGGTISGKWDAGEGNNTTLAAQLQNILQGHAYINFHTTQFGGGEVRGTLNLAPGITTGAALPPATVGAPYSQTLAASGGTPPLTWALVTGSTLPAGLTLSSAGVLSGTPTTVGTFTFTVGVTATPGSFSTQTFSLTVLPNNLDFSGAIKIGQVADAPNLVTQFAIVNLQPAQVSFQFKFWSDTGTALALPMQNGAAGNLAGTLAPGAAAFAQTAGTSTAPLQGWVEVASTGRVGVLAVYKLITPAGTPDSEASVIGSQSGSNILLPFDNTQGSSTGVAIANSNATQSIGITITFTPESGSPTTRVVSLPPRGHTSFVMPTFNPDTANQRGTIRLVTGPPDLAVVVLRFGPKGSFSSITTPQ